MFTRNQNTVSRAGRSKLALSVVSVLALAGYMGSSHADESAGESGSATEEVVVTGIRGALANALDIKRDTNSVVDTVTAEDIGKFPDKNIGDALQRIPGITVLRGFGEVNGVTIRGTAPQHSIILLNGQSVASTSWFDLAGTNRAFNFELLSAEQISRMDVYKSAEANINEGAMGGAVNLKTRRPLDMDAFTAFGSVEFGYSESAEDWSPAYAGLVSWKNEEENFGILLAYSNEEQHVVRETLSAFSPPTPGTITDNAVPPNSYTATCCVSSIIFDEERERESTQLTAQYRPQDNLTLTLDYNLFSLDNDHINSAFFGIPGFAGAVMDSSTTVVNSRGALVRGTVIPNASGSGAPIFNNTVLRTPQMETDVTNITLEYDGGSWSAHGVVGSSNSTSRTWQSSTWWGDVANPASTGFTYDISGPLELILNDPDYALDHSRQQIFTEFTYLNNIRDNEIDYMQADFSIDIDAWNITTLDVGVKDQEQFYLGAIDFRDLSVADAQAAGLSLADFNGGTVSGLHSQEGRPGTLTSFAIGSRSIWDYARANQTASVIGSDFTITEDITAFYIQANFEGEVVRGNIGVRYVETDVLSTGRIAGEPARGTKDYTNTLPNLNLVANITDDVLARFAYGSTISRPDYEDMQMAATISPSFNRATIGNPDIEPYTSDNMDIGIEWYFAEGSLLSATLFQKDISDYIEQSTAIEFFAGCGLTPANDATCQVTRARNVGKADVDGFELQYQHDFGNGYGVQVNYTNTDSSVTNSQGRKTDLEDVSDNSYNIAGYFENNIISARLAYNFRSGWQNNYNGSGPNSKYDDYEQLDASVVWHVMEKVDISFEAVNMLNEARIQRQPDFDVVHSVDEYGARYYIGASVRL